MMATLGCLARPATNFLISDSGTAPPVGLPGVLMMMSDVRGVIWASTSSAEKENPFASLSAIGTAVAPEY